MTDRTRLTLHVWLLWGLGLGALALAAAERWRGGATDATAPLLGVGLVVCGSALAALRDRLERGACGTPVAPRRAE